MCSALLSDAKLTASAQDLAARLGAITAGGSALNSSVVGSTVVGSTVVGSTVVGSSVVGVGVDAVDVARFRRILARRSGFAARFFSETEQADAGRSPDPAESLAARFAAKEAVMKALGTGLGGFALTDVEVRRSAGPGATRNAPSVALHGSAATLAAQRGVGLLHLSLTHTSQVAIAFVVAERLPSCSPS
jgi:holo-[acyl-carrier protein] synthase